MTYLKMFSIFFLTLVLVAFGALTYYVLFLVIPPILSMVAILLFVIVGYVFHYKS